MPRQSPARESAGMHRDEHRTGRRTVHEAARENGSSDGKSPVRTRQLSSVDAAFLYLERKEIPLHIASVTIFDGPIPFKKFVATINSKLRFVPRYAQIVDVPPLNLGLPVWKDDPHFDIHRHIFRVTLEPPGGQAQLEALAGRILSPMMDRSKPLWDIHVIDGLKGGRGAIIWRVHHALADGISGTRLLEVMLDSTPRGGVRETRLRPAQPPASDGSAPDGMATTVRNTLGTLITVEKGLLGLVESLLSDQTQNALKGLLKLLPELAVSVERLPFNKPCGGARKFCWAELDFADVRAVRETVGGTVNDIILTVLTRALARYVKLHGETADHRFVRFVCPVALRHGDPNVDLGNQISFMPVALPMDVRSPVQMLRAVSKRTETMKRAGVAHLLLTLVAGCIAAAPAALQALFWKGLPEFIFPLPLFNMICTNVPGPAVPLYAVGRRMIAAYPQVPTGYDLGVNVAVESYDGKLCFGFIADAVAASDVNRLRDFLYIAFRELCRSAGVKPAAPKKARPRVVAVRESQTGISEPAVAAASHRRATEAPPTAAAVGTRPEGVWDLRSAETTTAATTPSATPPEPLATSVKDAA